MVAHLGEMLRVASPVAKGEGRRGNPSGEGLSPDPFPRLLGGISLRSVVEVGGAELGLGSVQFFDEKVLHGGVLNVRGVGIDQFAGDAEFLALFL